MFALLKSLFLTICIFFRYFTVYGIFFNFIFFLERYRCLQKDMALLNVNYFFKKAYIHILSNRKINGLEILSLNELECANYLKQVKTSSPVVDWHELNARINENITRFQMCLNSLFFSNLIFYNKNGFVV